MEDSRPRLSGQRRAAVLHLVPHRVRLSLPRADSIRIQKRRHAHQYVEQRRGDQSLEIAEILEQPERRKNRPENGAECVEGVKRGDGQSPRIVCPLDCARRRRQRAAH